MYRRVVAAVIAFVVSLSLVRAAQGLTPPGGRLAAENFSVTDAGGRVITLTSLKGKVVLLDFWATWCAGCKEEMPWFMEFQKQYGRRGLASIGVALDEDGWTSVRPYLMTHPINYPIAVADQIFASKYGFQAALPVTVLIDRSGRIAEVHQGKVDKARFETDIVHLLEETARR